MKSNDINKEMYSHLANNGIITDPSQKRLYKFKQLKNRKTRKQRTQYFAITNPFDLPRDFWDDKKRLGSYAIDHENKTIVDMF